MTATEKEKCKGGREELCTSQGEENNLSEAKHDERVEDEDSLLVLGARQDGDGFTRFPFLPRIDGVLYPNAKVILTVRDPEKWYVSVADTFRNSMPEIVNFSECAC